MLSLCLVKKLKGGPFGEKKNLEKKSHNAEKLKGGTLWGFSTSILSQNIKKLNWGKSFPRKSLAVPKKKLKGGTFRRKVQFARPNSAIWCNNIL